MTLYLDASVLVAMVTPDVFRERALALIQSTEATLLVSDFARAELASAVALKVRKGALTPSQARAVFTRFDAWAHELAEATEITPADVRAGEALVRRLDLTLRAPDAIHIATARRLAARLATFDARMTEAATALGVELT